MARTGKAEKALIEAIQKLADDKGITVEEVADRISSHIVTAAKRQFDLKDKDRNKNDEEEDFIPQEEAIRCKVDPKKGTISLFIRKLVVSEVGDPSVEVNYDEACLYNPGCLPDNDEYVYVPIEKDKLGRLSAGIFKNELKSSLRGIDNDRVRTKFADVTGRMVPAVVKYINPTTRDITVEIFGVADRKVNRKDYITGELKTEVEGCECILLQKDCMPGRKFRIGSKIEVFVKEIKDTNKGPRVVISQTSPDVVRRLFETEISEIQEGIVEIKKVARSAGVATKIAVASNDEDVDPVGACIGRHSTRIDSIVEKLGGEQLQIIKYSDDPAEFVAAALAPATVLRVETNINEDGEKICKAYVPSDKSSLAIGKGSVNVRLAGWLTGWKIEIRNDDEQEIKEADA